MDHTPMMPATDDRPLRFLERAPVPAEHHKRLAGMVRKAQQLAADAGQELQSEFGPDHVGLIVNHNQFLRLFKAGTQPGAVDAFLDPAEKEWLSAQGCKVAPPEGAVFKLFGWARLDPMQVEPIVLDAVVAGAFKKAMRGK